MCEDTTVSSLLFVNDDTKMSPSPKIETLPNSPVVGVPPTSKVVSRLDRLSSVEKIYLQKSKRCDHYANEHICVIETGNVADLGHMTALAFIEWIVHNPNGVIGLPTGKTPELFIKWLRYYKANWTDKSVQQEMTEMGIIVDSNRKELSQRFPPTQDLRFVQLDEFFPISSKQHNSFLNYIRQYYMTTLELKEENVLTMDFSTLPIFQKYEMGKVFPNYKCDLSLLNSKPANELEELQQTALKQVEKFCEEYENKVRAWGGYGFFLGGIGHDGHIAFNFRGCDPSLGTRLVCFNYETAAQSATDFGGITFTRNKCAVTVGLSTITYNPNVRVIIIAAGEGKAPQVRDAIMLPPDRQRPASVLQSISGARFYLTQGSSLYLTDRRTEDVIRACQGEEPVDQSLLYEVVINLALRLQKPVAQLTVQDFLVHPMTKAVYIYWTSQTKPITKLTRDIHKYLVNMVERGTSLPVGKRILNTGPHHDDIMLAYHEATPFLIQNNENWFAYITSGFNSVADDYMSSVIKRVDLSSNDDIEKYIKPALFMHLSEIMDIFRNAYEADSEVDVTFAETLIILRRLRQTYMLKTVEDMIAKIKYLLLEYFPKKEPGAKDDTPMQIWKGSIRESECDRMWALQYVIPQTHVLHLRSKFYTGDFFNPMPTIKEDAAPMLEVYEKVRPDIVSVAFDPEGTGPDTHYKVLQVVAQALRLGREKQSKLPVKRIWGYRNVWYRFHLSRANIAIPVTIEQMNEMHHTFLACFGCQKKAEFPSPEYDGPFSVLGQRFRVDQWKELKILLGETYFTNHWNSQLRQADGVILLKEMDVDEFLKHAEDLRSKVELHKLL